METGLNLIPGVVGEQGGHTVSTTSLRTILACSTVNWTILALKVLVDQLQVLLRNEKICYRLKARPATLNFPSLTDLNH